MIRWSQKDFQKTHPTLYKTIIEAINEALIIDGVSNHVIYDDWIHEERVKQNDDTYCPICGKKLQSK